ncbi:YdcF family protein [Nereida sp. MMG025]|uniref:YdcF family protein n=1 Tax=Nereida sp. MMG025 TaxID=2909981 RepID=UPI001F25F9D8|nr:YdcF family protein [Nereida sp. MMG025]MCF6443256.1 YdcF family protein [Nereida sp. MMG025]
MGVIGKLIRAALVGGGLCILGVFAVFISVVLDERRSPNLSLSDGDKVDAVVVLAGGMTNKIRLTNESMARFERGAALFSEGIGTHLVFSGYSPAQNVSEAELMGQLAAQAGVSPDAIVVEQTSRSTLQNALFTADIIGRDQRILVVTSRTHIDRAKRAFLWAGFTQVETATTDFRQATLRRHLRGMWRETRAICFNALRAPIWTVGHRLGMARDNLDWIIA